MTVNLNLISAGTNGAVTFEVTTLINNAKVVDTGSKSDTITMGDDYLYFAVDNTYK